jgi:hypothetical protein
MIYQCEICGKDYEHEMYKKKTKLHICSSECAGDNLKRKRQAKVEESRLLRLAQIKKCTCVVCNKEFELKPYVKKHNNSITFPNRVTCSEDCENKYRQLQIEKTNNEKYGVKSTFQTETVKEKSKETRLKLYGFEYTLQDPIIVKKANDKAKSEEAKEKKKNTCLTLYGFDHQMKSEEIKEKSKQKCLEKYGVEYSFQSMNNKEKSKKTCLEKYGVEYVTQNKDIKSKILYNNRIARIQKLAAMNLIKDVDFFIVDDIPKFKCKKCGNEWEPTFNSSFSFDRCNVCFPIGYPFLCSTSKKELELLDFIKKYSYFSKTRKILHGLELDMYSDSLKLAIEFNGIYYHSELAGKDSKYHLNKTEMCEKENIRLIHISEYEFDYKKELIFSMLQSIFGDTKKIYARKCTVKELDNPTYYAFCMKNHIQGHAQASIKLGLFFNDTLVQIMSFAKPRFNSKYDYEMIRECSSLNTQIIGGKGKLLKFFERNYNPKSIISYCDRRYFTGNSYIKLGFTLNSLTPPSYTYHKWIRGQGLVLKNRVQCQKHKLKDFPNFKFNSELTEWENMQENGWNRTWDCGQKVFVKYF